MKATNLLLIILAMLLLTGCQWFTKKVDASYTPVVKPELVLPDADQIRMRNVEWFIITPENQQEVFARLADNNNAVVLIGLTSNGYESLSLNLSDVRAYIQQQQSIISAYKQYYILSEQAIDKINKQIAEDNKQ